jgi:hypothetical protein
MMMSELIPGAPPLAIDSPSAVKRDACMPTASGSAVRQDVEVGK